MTVLTEWAPPEPDWELDAACTESDPELFFPKPKSGHAAQAKRICRECPVIRDCGLWAIYTGQDGGIWGGMTENQRARKKRQMEDLLSAPSAA